MATGCPKSLALIFIVTYKIKLVKTSLTYSIDDAAGQLLAVPEESVDISNKFGLNVCELLLNAFMYGQKVLYYTYYIKWGKTFLNEKTSLSRNF